MRRSLIAVMAFVAFASAARSEQPDLQLVTEQWPPYNYSMDGDVGGFSVDVVRAIMHRLGEKHAIRVYPGPRGHKMLETLPNVMSFSLFRTPEREDRYKWIGPLSSEAIYFYKRHDDPRHFNELADVQAVASIVAPHRGLIFNRLSDLGLGNLNGVAEWRRQFDLVVNKRADLLVNRPPLGIHHALREMNLPTATLVSTGFKLMEFPLYIAGSKAIPDEVISRWQAALDAIREAGEYARIYQQHLN